MDSDQNESKLGDSDQNQLNSWELVQNQYQFEDIFDEEEKSFIDSLGDLEYVSDIFAKILISFNLLIRKKYRAAHENLIPYLQEQ